MNTTLEAEILVPGCTVATTIAPPPPNEIHDECEAVLAQFDENERALNALRLAKVHWERELNAISEREEGVGEEELERVSRLESAAKSAPSKIRALAKRGEVLRRRLQKEFGVRWLKIHEIAFETAREMEVRMVKKLERIFEGDLQAATKAARLVPTVAAAIMRAEVELNVIDKIDPTIGLRQLLALEVEIVKQAREILARK